MSLAINCAWCEGCGAVWRIRERLETGKDYKRISENVAKKLVLVRCPLCSSNAPVAELEEKVLCGEKK